MLKSQYLLVLGHLPAMELASAGVHGEGGVSIIPLTPFMSGGSTEG